MNPYYQDEYITLYNVDCRDIIESFSSSHVIISDPPYGNGKDGRREEAFFLEKRGYMSHIKHHHPMFGNDELFDPRHLLRFERVILFGANNYADLLPISPAWIVWDKILGLKSDRSYGYNYNSDAELIYTHGLCDSETKVKINRVITFRHRWVGFTRETEAGPNGEWCHSGQKPIELIRQFIDFFTFTTDVILDPYTGSGTILIAAKKMGNKSIGCEISEESCEIAVKRILRHTT